MRSSSRPAWLQEIVEEVSALLEKEGGEQRASSPRLRMERRVTRAYERGDGWYVLSTNERDFDERLDDARLAPEEGTDRHAYRLIESEQDGNLLYLHVSESAPDDGLYLWVSSSGPAALTKSLLERLVATDTTPLLERFHAGKLDSVPDLRGAPEHLDPSQQQAWKACVAEGLHAVWGPPGTGKTQVIAHALETLIGEGKSVLLVSGTNAAVDNAVERAVRRIGPQLGEVVRVGTPHIAAVAQDPRMSVSALIRERLAGLEFERQEIQDKIADLRTDDRIVRLEECERIIRPFEEGGLATARERVAKANEVRNLRSEMDRTSQRLERECDGLAVDRQASAKACERYNETSAARVFLDQADSLNAELNGFIDTRDRALGKVVSLREDVDDVHRALESIQSQGMVGRLRSRPIQRQLVRKLEQSQDQLTTAEARCLDAEAILRRMTERLQPRIDAHLRSAIPWTRADVETRRVEMERAQTLGQSRSVCINALEMELRDKDAQLARLEAGQAATPADYDLLERAEQAAYDRERERLPALQTDAAPLFTRIEKLEAKHEDLLRTQEVQKRTAEDELIAKARVVATTLAMLRRKPAIYERTYDHVFIDEAAAASPPEAVYAMSRGRSGITLLGDFLQNGPIDPFENDRAHPRRWYGTDCFHLIGITDPDSAERSQGCVVLRAQRRFGEAVTALVNDVAYGGLLERDPGVQTKPAGPEIVLIDVDGLSTELATPMKGQEGSWWWPIGAMVARALAERHVSHENDTVGVVTPYRAQREMVANLLSESGSSQRIEVGTSHKFQGREFDIVIFDLVEDGTNWIFKAAYDRRNLFAFKGLRVFTVGLTRARRRVYLIANLAAVRRARTGPLQAVSRRIEAGDVHVVRAADLLRAELPPVTDTVATELWDSLRSYVKLVDVYDEDDLPEALLREIAEAQHTLWIWSPWVGRNVNRLLGSLVDAKDRQVDVRVVVRPARKVATAMRPFVSNLCAAIDNVIFVDREHQKLIIIDRRVTFIGSMNILSHQGDRGTHDVMVLLESTKLASMLLAQEGADELANPPTCPTCAEPVREAGMKDSKWIWVCTDDISGRSGCGWRTPFANPGRNQRRANRRPPASKSLRI
ncbi:AAA domain-containing protein [Actinopolymorpha alba]|uniref:AAA domain-containing protein n=1 Tax=Actinopolymorpha alba TaxID=533267 RepID=UPI0012F6AA0F|nr:AAA domain-containing protein [Actinopolymorpha alba]